MDEKKEELKEEKKEEVKDKRPLGEKVEDKMDDIIGGIQDFIYGPGDDYSHDIPATIEKPNGIRVINKVQTRRNIYKRINKKIVLKIILGIFIFFGGLSLLISIIGLFF